jgi:hypothetical protein
MKLCMIVFKSFVGLRRFQILAPASMKMTVFWDVAQYSLVEFYRRFGGYMMVWVVPDWLGTGSVAGSGEHGYDALSLVRGRNSNPLMRTDNVHGNAMTTVLKSQMTAIKYLIRACCHHSIFFPLFI